MPRIVSVAEELDAMSKALKESSRTGFTVSPMRLFELARAAEDMERELVHLRWQLEGKQGSTPQTP